MKLEQQVCSLELAKKLKELGVKQESYFYWKENKDKKSYIERGTTTGIISVADTSTYYPICSAFTVAELGNIIMRNLKDKDENNSIVSIQYENTCCKDKDCDCGGTANYFTRLIVGTKRNFLIIDYPEKKYIPSEANSRAKMLIYLMENNLLTPASQDNE